MAPQITDQCSQYNINITYTDFTYETNRIFT